MQRSGLRALTLCLGWCGRRWPPKAQHEPGDYGPRSAGGGCGTHPSRRDGAGRPKESSDREPAVSLTFLLPQPPAQVPKAFRSEVDLRANPKFAASVMLLGPGTTNDFTSLVLEPNGPAEAKRYLTASPGDALNLSLEEIRAFDALASAGSDPKTDGAGQLTQLLLGRYQAYLAKGLYGMAPYARYNTSQAVAGPVPVSEGTMVFYRSRVSTDQLTGFGSSAKKSNGRGVMAEQLTQIFERSRSSFQRGAQQTARSSLRRVRS